MVDHLSSFSDFERDCKYPTASKAGLSLGESLEENVTCFFLLMFQSLEYISKEHGVWGVFVCENNHYFPRQPFFENCK